MKPPKKYREDAKRCRELLDCPVEPELRAQLRLWAAELDDLADAIERGPEGICTASVRARSRQSAIKMGLAYKGKVPSYQTGLYRVRDQTLILIPDGAVALATSRF
jgi:hypothetical protein